VFRGFYDVAVLLLDAGADVDARSTKNPEDRMLLCDRTPLTQAATNGQVDVVRLLLRRGASFDLCDCNGRTAEVLARLYYWNNPNKELDDEVDEFRIISERQWVQNRTEAGALLREVREAGGWRRYIFPRRCLPVRLLRILCEMGRAKTDDALLARLFPWHPPAAEPGPETRASLRARDTRSAGVPRDVFCLIFEFWRFVDDWRPSEPLAYGWAGGLPTYSAWQRVDDDENLHEQLGNAGEDTDDEEIVGYDGVLGTENNPDDWLARLIV
jgi:hypothetical protein